MLQTAEDVFSRGWKKMKLYFMIGLPTEEDEDVIAIMETGKKAKQVAQQKCGVGNPAITISVSSFVPKPHTPFQWANMISLEEIIRKRGFLKAQDSKRAPISDNVMIEELLGSDGCICVEDVIDGFWRCKQNPTLYKRLREVLWPFQLAARKETASDKVTKHEATSRDVKKSLTKAWKGGHLGFRGEQINDFVQALI